MADDKETANFFARRTESVDAAGIANLVQRRTETVFGRVNVEYVIERATLGITLVGGEEEGGGEVLAHGSLLDYPVPSSGVEPACWEEWSGEHFTADIRASPMNTLFLHLFVAKDGFQQAAITEILRIAFVAVPLLQYVVITTPPATSLGSGLQPHFSVWPVAEGRSPSHVAYVTHRHQHFPQLHVRPARVEDADDLMSIFNEYSHDITEDYGDYILAELVESQDSQHKTIIAEVGGCAVGFVSVTSEVDLGPLDQSFVLESYHHLRHPAPPSLESDLRSQSVQSIATSDHLHSSSSSTSLVGGEQESTSPEGKQKREEGSQNQLASSSSLARLAQIAASTSSRSRLAQQSRSKLATHSQTQANKSGSNVAKSGSKISKSGPKVTESKSGTKDPDSGTKESDSKAKMVDSNIDVSKTTSKLAESKSKSMVESKTKLLSSKSGVAEQTTSQSELAGEGSTGESAQKMEEPTAEDRAEREEEERRRRLAGQPNAVAVQLFGIQDQFEMRSVDLLVAVFQAFPDHDFCLLSLPHTVPEFPLLSNFTRVPHREKATPPHELYVVHKCSLLHSFVVRQAVTSDLEGVGKLVECVEGREGVMSDVVRGVEGGRDGIKDGATPLFALVAECADQIVGVAVVRREEELLYLRSHYSVEDFVYMSHHRPQEHGRLHHLTLSPAFSPLNKHFLKEVMRKSSMTCLYYPSPLPLLPSSHPHTLTTALADMVPVKPRRHVVYPPRERLGVNQPLPQVLEEKQTQFALYHTNRKLSLEPKMVVNWRVVVVGASDTALSLLETLVFSPHLSFSNLSFLSPSGLPPSSSLSLLGLPSWVHVIPASLIAINREDKEVTVWREEEEEEEGVVPYDLLVLATGLQFSPPPLTSDLGESPLIYHGNDEGLGVLEWTQTYLQSQELLVCGSGLEVYTALQSLLDGGVDPSLITFVRPHPPSCFASRTVEEKVQRSLEESGVVLLTGHALSGVEEGGVCLTDGENTLFCSCKGLIYMGEKEVSSTVFTAVNDACLVFDKRLVIDRDHLTNDPHILAAGPMTKFSRSYHSDQWTHANFNSREVGQKLAASLLSRLDPTYLEPSVTSDPSLLPTYTQPKVIYTTLPGGLHYLHIDKPRPVSESQNTLANQTTTNNMGQELETDTENGYFRLCVNQYGSIQTITALSSQVIESANYQCLYGLHEKYLNNLLSRYSEGLIADLFTYLREPWTCAVYHDRFCDLREEVREALTQPQQPPAVAQEGGTSLPSVEERVRHLLSQQQTVSLDDHKEQLLSEFYKSPVKPSVQQLLHRYLRYNHYHLPMYAHPDIL